MDAASAALFQALALELESSAWVLLVTRRDVPGGLVLTDRPHQRIELGPLTREEAHALSAATVEAAHLPPHVVELAVERSGGSPQFLLDLLAAAGAGDREQLPDSLEAAAMARIDALDRSDGAIVRRAAVLGMSFDPRRLSDVLSPDTPLPDDRFWDRLSTVFADERRRSRALSQAGASGGGLSEPPVQAAPRAAPGGRAQARARAGWRSGRRPRGALQPLRARRGSRARTPIRDAGSQAGDRALLACRRRAAVPPRDRTGRAGGSADARALAGAWEEMGEALRCVGEPAAASRALTEARRLLRDDPIAQARLCDRHADVASRNQALAAAVRWLNRGFCCLENVESAEATAWRARMRSRLGGVRNRQGRWPEAITACRQAIEEADSVGELRALAHASYSLDWALVESGRRREADHSWRALEIYERLGDPEHEFDVLNNLGMFAYFDGLWEDAIALYRRAGACGERAGRPADAARVDCNVGEILSDQGHLDEAEAHLNRVRRVWNATGERQAVAFADVLLGRLAVRRGEVEEGVSILEDATAQLRRFDLHAYADFAQALVAEAEALAGDAERGLQIAYRELRTAERQRPVLQRAAGIALARLGQTDAARTELLGALASARNSGFEYDIAATIDALGRLNAADAAVLRERDEILDRLKIVRLAAPALN